MKKFVANIVVVAMVATSFSIPVSANSDNPPSIAIEDTLGCLTVDESGTYTTGWIRQANSAKITATAGASPISGIYYTRGDEETGTFVDSNNITVGVEADGILKYSNIYAIDADGDVSNSYNLTIQVDATAPVINSFTSEINSYNNEADFTFEISDETSGINEVILYKYDNDTLVWNKIATSKDSDSGMSLTRTDTGYTGTYAVFENGAYKLETLDNAGNTAEDIISVSNFNPDAPYIKTSIDGSSLSELSTNTYVAKSAKLIITGTKNLYNIKEVHYTYNERNFSVTGTTTSIPVTNEGENVFSNIYVIDVKGNIAYTSDISIFIDNIEPVITDFSYADGISEENLANGINYGTSANLFVTATENRAIKKYIWYYSTNGVNWVLSTEHEDITINDDNEYADTLSVNKNGFYCVVTYDYVGLIDTSTAIEITSIDTDGPKVNIVTDKPNKKDWYCDEVSVTFDCIDDKSGFDYITYAIDGNTTFEVLTEPFVTSETKTLNYIAYDKLGNSTQGKINLYIDKSNPTIETSLSDVSTFKTSDTLFYSASDEDSGIDTTYLDIFEDGVWKEYVSGDEFFTITKNGTFRIRTTDVAGRTTMGDSFAISNIDNISPSEAEITAIESGWNRTCTLSVFSLDEYSGIQSIEIYETEAYESGEELIPESSYYADLTDGFYALSASYTCTLDENGTYTLVATDGAGNTKTTDFTVSNIDTSNPVITNVSVSNEKWTKSSVSVNIIFSDSESGINKIELEKYIKETDSWATVGN